MMEELFLIIIGLSVLGTILIGLSEFFSSKPYVGFINTRSITLIILTGITMITTTVYVVKTNYDKHDVPFNLSNILTTLLTLNKTPTGEFSTTVDYLNAHLRIDSDKLGKMVIVYKAGQTESQDLYRYAIKVHPELKPSENILWVPTTKQNKKESKLVADSTKYPSIHYWIKDESNVKEEIIEQPTDKQLDEIVKLAKQYKTGT